MALLVRKLGHMNTALNSTVQSHEPEALPPPCVDLWPDAHSASEAPERTPRWQGHPPPGAPVPPILPPVNGYLILDKAKFAAAFAGDVAPERAAFLASAQVPWGVDPLAGEVTEAAWHIKPSWYLVTKEDKMIPPDAQRGMSKRAGATVVEIAGSHAIYESKPAAVAALIEKAATSTQ
jgi:hypothetical protein